MRPELPVTVSQTQRGFDAYNSPMLAVDPTERRFVVLAHRQDGPSFGCQLSLSGDGGRTFVPATPVTDLPAGAERCYAPEVAFGRDGVLYYLFVGLKGPTNTPMGAFLASSRNRGRSFSQAERVLGPNNFFVRLAMDQGRGTPGRLHVVFVTANGAPGLGSFPQPPNPIRAMHSDDGGRTFSRPVTVSDPHRQRVVAPALVVAPGGDVHVLYYDLLRDERDYHGLEGPTWEEPWSLVLATSRSDGRRFAPGVVVDDAVVPPERVMLIFTMPPPAIVATKEELLVAWHDARNGDWDVFIRRSGDGGRQWRAPLRLNDDEIGNGRHQYQPALSVSPGGRVDAIFYDRRHDQVNVSNHVVYTSSSNGGLDFGSNKRLTKAPSDSRVGQRYVGAAAEGLFEFGSRLGLLATDGMALAAWTDTRNSVHPIQQDVFSTQVVMDEPDDDDGAPPLPVLIAALAAAAVLVVARRRRSRRRRGRRGSAAVAVLLAATACAGAPEPVLLPRPPSLLDVAMTEGNRFQVRGRAVVGRAIFQVANRDDTTHQLVLVRLPDDFPGRLGDPSRPRSGGQAVGTLTVLPLFAPRHSTPFAADLSPGRYGLLCFVEDPDGKTHADKGMSTEFTVESGDVATTASSS